MFKKKYSEYSFKDLKLPKEIKEELYSSNYLGLPNNLEKYRKELNFILELKRKTDIPVSNLLELVATFIIHSFSTKVNKSLEDIVKDLCLFSYPELKEKNLLLGGYKPLYFDMVSLDLDENTPSYISGLLELGRKGGIYSIIEDNLIKKKNFYYVNEKDFLSIRPGFISFLKELSKRNKNYTGSYKGDNISNIKNELILNFELSTNLKYLGEEDLIFLIKEKIFPLKKKEFTSLGLDWKKFLDIFESDIKKIFLNPLNKIIYLEKQGIYRKIIIDFFNNYPEVIFLDLKPDNEIYKTLKINDELFADIIKKFLKFLKIDNLEGFSKSCIDIKNFISILKKLDSLDKN